MALPRAAASRSLARVRWRSNVMIERTCFLLVAGCALAFSAVHAAIPSTNAAPAVGTNAGSRLLRPLSLAEALDIALQQNSAIRKSVADLKAAHGLIVQTRAIAWPKLGISGNYTANEESSSDTIRAPAQLPTPGGGSATSDFEIEIANQRWSADVRVTQSVYEGGRMTSAFRTARLTREQALLNHETVIADTLRDVRVAYYDVLLAQQLIAVQEASLKLLEKELEETTKRMNAGTVPRFNVLRAEVEVANARPKLIRARNSFRTSKDRLANLLGERIPKGTDELPLQLTDKLEAGAWAVDLSAAVQQAFGARTELQALRKAELLRAEKIREAKAGYKPSVQVFAGYGTKSSQFTRDLTEELHGWEAGAQLQWQLFDGFLTQGRIEEAEALHTRAGEELAEAERNVEVDVRAAYSSFIEAREVLRSQEKVQESAEESLRLATARAEAGTATQLDVLNAQTALTEARSTQAQALHDYAVARARLERAVGQTIEPEKAGARPAMK
jgi:outer membrane protein